ncbi:hypothetical protein JTB14_033189 [Gonioctena quinquepunctata]|nr:hypothetical protein JTB14_033189 [Gonioctena quinquepunctata]
MMQKWNKIQMMQKWNKSKNHVLATTTMVVIDANGRKIQLHHLELDEVTLFIYLVLEEQQLRQNLKHLWKPGLFCSPNVSTKGGVDSLDQKYPTIPDMFRENTIPVQG